MVGECRTLSAMAAPSYRLLEKGEVIELDDEYFDDDRRYWRATRCAGDTAPDPAYTSHRIYRRRLSRGN